MSPFEIADLLEGYASDIRRLPGASRTNPHVFLEAKSELAGQLMQRVKMLRTIAPPPSRPVGTIHPGVRTIGSREVVVVRRARQT